MRISDWSSDVCSSDLGSRRTSPRHHSGANRISNLQNPHVLNGSSLGGSGRVRYRPSCSGFCCIDAIGRLVCCPVSEQSSLVLPRFRGIAWKLPNGRSEEHTSELQ